MLTPNSCIKYDRAFSLCTHSNRRIAHLGSTLTQILVDGEIPKELSYLERELQGDELRNVKGLAPETYAAHVFQLLQEEDLNQALVCFEDLTTSTFCQGIDPNTSICMMLAALTQYCEESRPADICCWNICSLAERSARTPDLAAGLDREALVGKLFALASVLVPQQMPEWIRLFERLEETSKLMDPFKLVGHFCYTSTSYDEHGHTEPLQNHMMEVLARISPRFCERFEATAQA